VSGGRTWTFGPQWDRAEQDSGNHAHDRGQAQSECSIFHHRYPLAGQPVFKLATLTSLDGSLGRNGSTHGELTSKPECSMISSQERRRLSPKFAEGSRAKPTLHFGRGVRAVPPPKSADAWLWRQLGHIAISLHPNSWKPLWWSEGCTFTRASSTCVRFDWPNSHATQC
jgi:hypothetical protein